MTGEVMPAAVFAGPGRVAVMERPTPAVERPDDVLIAVRASGICGTDLQILSVPPGHPAPHGVVLGHEFAGEILEVGPDVHGLCARDHVVVAPNVSCGQCPPCRRGLRNHCENYATYGIHVDGGLAPQVCVAAAACHPISPRVPWHIAALAEPLSTVVHGASRAEPFPGETAVVIGGGPIGLMFAALFGMAGCRVVVVEPTPGRAALAEAMGAVRVVAPGEEAVAAARELSGGMGADVVVDAVGSQLGAALELVRKAGRVVLFGVNERARTDLAQIDVTRDELTIMGSFVGQDVFPAAIGLLEAGGAAWERMVTHQIGLPELPDAVEELRAGRAVKVEVEFGG